MRNQEDVNAHRSTYRQYARSNGSAIRIPRLLDEPEVRRPQYLDLFLPRKETRLMSDEANRTGGLFMPYPLLGLLLTLVLALGGGIAGLFIQVNSLQTTILLRDVDYQRQMKDNKDKLDQMEIYLHNDRERLAVIEHMQLQEKRRSN